MPNKSGDLLIIFTRYPEPGKVKTRLIPALGEAGAAELHRQMTIHTLRLAKQLARRHLMRIEVHFDGANEPRLRQSFGADFRYRGQGEGDLGERLRRAFWGAFQQGMNRVIIIGTDCPGISVDLIARAFNELQNCDLVLGPAQDGGYYLIGLRTAIPQLFAEIPWGTAEVLEKTLKAAAAQSLATVMLETLADIDRPEDLPLWEETKSRSEATRRRKNCAC